MSKFYITKYALTHGILEIDGEESAVPGCEGLLSVKGKDAWCGFVFHGEGREWHRTRAAAVNKAREMVLKKRVSLLKQLKRVESLKLSLKFE